MNFPKISIVMPTYNEEKKIGRSLKSIREQNYPKNKIEIIVVDDNSEDKTVEIAKKYKAVVVKNGRRDYDIGKTIGIEKATGEYIMFLDGDNFLTEKNWIKKIITPLLKDKTIIGCQPMWMKYDKDYPFFDRYGALFGISDPLSIYLGKRSSLMHWETKWKNGLIADKKDYFVAKFNKENLPTIGSVGFTIKKEYLLKTNWTPAFSHVDCMQDLLKLGYNKFAFAKLDIIHLHSTTFKDFLGKLKRNFKIFIRDFDKRRYKWDAPLTKKMAAVLIMLTFIIPFYHSIRGYIKIKDPVWFIHPFVCFITILMYLKIFILWKIGIKPK